ncbi:MULTISPECIES: capsule biosynthesis protein [unclassified Novosphingobium]|uniref:capsule biosynthesis protein n=1 Tax=unclassified Novosphingobium TaxID=2644732 RepID=UPI00086E182A|nr:MULTISPECIES: capsule biosynthesis protein [unclassified Novosphingobium]MBN9142678.1 capsule biosynthesis protein [Novosphingobium sp.]MDR6705762.1 capsular polysaccharide transport system permease protein [Novosphingobium sp. 1748]ODU85139.1 MAG: capsule biosynthesis protein [Novosphingobium sp. SCN 63-17]OJX89083.1 MAG: capsule biosynthesis protein [Novosphingobium sp. 63-713]
MNLETTFSEDAMSPPRRSAALLWVQKNRWFFLFVIVPVLLSCLYYGLIASDVYVSESRFVIKAPDQKHSQVSSLANLIQTTGLSSGQEQANEVLDFVRSRDALANLERKVDIRRRYGNGGDVLSRFPSALTGDSFEYLYKYYANMVDADIDTQTGTAVVKVKAFTADDAFQINQALLGMSEDMVNRLNARAQERGIAEAEHQVAIATERTRKVTAQLTAYRNQSALIDPGKQAVGVIEIANQMVAQRAALQAQLETMQRETPRNPAIPALANRVAALSGQIAQQNGQVVGGSSTIASKLGNYEGLLVEQKFANESLTAANAGLVQARAEAQKQQFYLERVVEPNRPDTALLPHRLLSILTVAACALCLYFIGWMLMIGILEHAPEK